MIRYYKTVENTLIELERAEKGCWVAVEAPTSEEIEFLSDQLGIRESFVHDSIDIDERSRMERDGDQTLVILDMPMEAPVGRKGGLQFYTLPIGFVLTSEYVVTLTNEPTPLIRDVAEGNGKNGGIRTDFRTHFLLMVTFKIASQFILHLGAIDKIAFQTEKELARSMKNSQLIQLLELQKSLVYFTISLKATEATLEKLKVGRALTLTEEDGELLEDTLIEIKQSIETATVYTGVLTSTMEAVAAIISNNMNIVMKVLTSLTIVLSVPNMVFGFYGMNVALPDTHTNFLPPMMISLGIMGAAALVLHINGFFKS